MTQNNGEETTRSTRLTTNHYARTCRSHETPQMKKKGTRKGEPVCNKLESFTCLPTPHLQRKTRARLVNAEHQPVPQHILKQKTQTHRDRERERGEREHTFVMHAHVCMQGKNYLHGVLLEGSPVVLAERRGAAELPGVVPAERKQALRGEHQGVLGPARRRHRVQTLPPKLPPERPATNRRQTV